MSDLVDEVEQIVESIEDDETVRLMHAYVRFLRWDGYLEETYDERARMVSEGSPPLSLEHASWVVGTYAPPGIDPHGSPIKR